MISIECLLLFTSSALSLHLKELDFFKFCYRSLYSFQQPVPFTIKPSANLLCPSSLSVQLPPHSLNVVASQFAEVVAAVVPGELIAVVLAELLAPPTMSPTTPLAKK